MKTFVTALVFAALAAVPGLAFTQGGISGHIVDISSGKMLAGVPLEIYRMPIRPGDRAIARLRTNARGFFVKVPLSTGRYMVAALADGKSFGCIVDDVFQNNVTNFTLGVGSNNTVCTGPRVHAGLVNANITADLTTIR